MAGLVCDIVTPESKLFSDDAYMVVVPGVEGEMGFLEGHVPLVSPLADGFVRLTKENGGEATKFALQGGYCEVTGEKVIVLADRACKASDIDVAAAKEKLAELQQKRADMSDEEAANTTIDADISWYSVCASA